jgi:hypothetical protein
VLIWAIGLMGVLVVALGTLGFGLSASGVADALPATFDRERWGERAGRLGMVDDVERRFAGRPKADLLAALGRPDGTAPGEARWWVSWGWIDPLVLHVTFDAEDRAVSFRVLED